MTCKTEALSFAMNPQTGGIYAMASSPDFNPNDYDEILDADTQAELDALKEQYGADSESMLRLGIRRTTGSCATRPYPTPTSLAPPSRPWWWLRPWKKGSFPWTIPSTAAAPA